MALRVPPQFAFLTCKGIFNSVVLADAGKRSERGGSKGLFVDWDLLGLQKPAAPPSSSLPNMHLDFDKHVARDVANILRRYCENLDPNDDFDFVEYNHVAQLVSVMMDLQDQLDPVFFTRFAGICNTGPQLLLHMVHNVESSNIKCCGCFKFLLMSDCLRQTGQLKKVIVKSIELVVPPVLVNVFRHALTSSALAIPNKGTLSRWRLLLDGGFMLWHRAKNKSGSFLRWMMTDSSTQHGRSFQLTSILSLNVQSALRALSDANDLVMLWHFDLFGSLFFQIHFTAP